MTITAIILAAAKSVGVPGALLLAICSHESNLDNVVVPRDGSSASIGFCQIKESTAQNMGYKGIAYGPLKSVREGSDTMEPAGKPAGLMIPSVNAKYAAKYLKMQLKRYGGDWCKATAAYNAGTYNPSIKSPGKPRNLKYVNSVVLKLDEEHKDYLMCGERKVED